MSFRKIILFTTLFLFLFCLVGQILIAEEYPPEEIVGTYYQFIDWKSPDRAYYLRSRSWQSTHSMEWFKNNWSNNNTIELVKFKTVYNDGFEAIVEVRVYSEDYDDYGNLKTGYYSGEAYLSSNSNGNWLIDDIVLSKE